MEKSHFDPKKTSMKDRNSACSESIDHLCNTQVHGAPKNHSYELTTNNLFAFMGTRTTKYIFISHWLWNGI